MNMTMSQTESNYEQNMKQFSPQNSLMSGYHTASSTPTSDCSNQGYFNQPANNHPTYDELVILNYLVDQQIYNNYLTGFY